MKFVQHDAVWHLVQETADGPSRIIATLRSEVEVAALAEFCRLTLSAPGRIPEHFPVRHGGTAYTVTPLGAPTEKLSLVIAGGEMSVRVATEFTMPACGS